MENDNKNEREKITDAMTNILSLLDDAYEALQTQKTSGAPKQVKEQVMDQLLVIHGKIEKLTSTLNERAQPAQAINTTTSASTVMQQQMDKMENDIAEIKAAIKESTKTKSESWTQIAMKNTTAQSKTPNIMATVVTQIQKAQEKHRIMTPLNDLTLTTTNEETRNELHSKLSYKDITERLQQAVNKRCPELHCKAPKLVGIKKLQNGNIKITGLSNEELNILQLVNWNLAFKGLEVRYPQHGFVIHGIPKEDITIGDENTKIIDELVELNNVEITKIAPLHRKQTKSDSKYQSIVIFTDCPESLAIALQHGFHIKYRLYSTEPYTPQFQLTQCFNCQQYGHRVAECKNKPTCGKCGSKKHKANDCTVTKYKCSNCNGNHEAWSSSCPIKTTEKQKQRQLRKSAMLFPL
jgi:hypothetical protein